MATEKLLNTRIALKIDTLSNWNNSTLPLKKGEVCFATAAASIGNGLTEPVVMAKVCTEDGKTFSQLDWAFHAKASDVLSVCKNEKELQDFIGAEITKAGLATNNTVTELTNRVTTAESDIDALEAKVGTDTVTKQIQDAIAALNLANTYDTKGAAADVQANLDAYEASNDQVIANIKNGAELDSFKDVEDALDTKQAVGDYATKTEAQGYADAKDAAIAAAKQAGDDAQAAADAAQGEIDALEAKVGTVPENNTVVGMIEAANEDIAENLAKIDAINNSGTGILAQAKAYTDTVKNNILGEGISETYDTLVEIQEWIEGDGVNATELTSAIAAEAKNREDADDALGTRIDGVKTTAEAAMPKSGGTFTGVVTLKQDPANALEAATKQYVDAQRDVASNAAATAQSKADSAYALAETKTTLAEVEAAIDDAGHALNSDLTAHTGNTDIHVTTTDKAKWNAAEQNAKDYADDLDAAMDGRVTAIKATADTAVQTVSTGTGLVANRSDNAVTIDFDDTVTFVFDCGNATT